MAAASNGACKMSDSNHRDVARSDTDVRMANYEQFLAVVSTSSDNTKHRRTASMRSDIGSRRKPVSRTPVRTGSAPRIDEPSLLLKEPPRLQRVRSFTKTSKGLVNRGDSVRRRENRKSSGNEKREATDTTETVKVSESPTTYFRVVVLGSAKVGKSSLVQQFMTSEYMGGKEANQEGDKTVSVVVDGLESSVDFVDDPLSQNIPEQANTADGYLVVYSLTDKRSFRSAYDVIASLRHDHGDGRVIILVANKNDLVRKRKVTEQDGKRAAHNFHCTYMETSAAICHNVDELLVRTVGDLRKMANPTSDPSDDRNHKTSGSKSGLKRTFTQNAGGLMRRMFNSIRRKRDK